MLYATFMQPTMSRLFWIAFAWIALLARTQGQGFDLAGTAGKVEKVTAQLISEVTDAAPGQPFRVAVSLVLAPGAHSYGQVIPEDVVGKPTRLKWTLPEGWKLEELPWPATHRFEVAGGSGEGYEGTVRLPVRITPPAEASAGLRVELAVKVDGLVCDDKTCVPFSKALVTPVVLAAQAKADPLYTAVFAAMDSSVAAPAAVAKPPGLPAPPTAVAVLNAPSPPEAPKPLLPLAQLLLYAFVGGLILNIMPCVFPVLGIKVASVVKQAGMNRRKVMLHGVMYTLGILLSFWVLGGLAIALGKGWGFQLQSPRFNFGLAAFFLVFALNMAGLFEIGGSAVGVGAGFQSKGGLGGSFFSGLLATVVATPCSAPFLGTALGATLVLPASQTMLIFTVIAFGLASPFLALAMVPQFISALPRPGVWMESFKQGMSFLLFGTVGFMLFVLASQIEGLPLLLAMLSLVLMAWGCWVYGRWALPHKSPRTILIARMLTAIALGAGLWFGFPGEGAGKSAGRTETAQADNASGLHWEKWSMEKVAALRAANQPVYIDFTASWCWTCQVNKRVYSDASLQALFKKHNVATLKADWSDENEPIREALKTLGKRAVPVNVLYLPGAAEPLILAEILTVAKVSEALNRIQ